MVVLHFLFFNIFLVVWRVNCSHTGEGELPTMDGRIAIRPYTCIFWMLANIHVIKYKYTCKYLNTCKLMIERIYIPT